MDIEPTSLFQKVRRYISRQRKISSVSERDNWRWNKLQGRKKEGNNDRKEARKKKENNKERETKKIVQDREEERTILRQIERQEIIAWVVFEVNLFSLIYDIKNTIIFNSMQGRQTWLRLVQRFPRIDTHTGRVKWWSEFKTNTSKIAKMKKFSLYFQFLPGIKAY